MINNNYWTAIDLIKQYNDSTNVDLIQKAYIKCKEWHGSQKRKSGDMYYTHPVAVAEEVVKMQLDDNTIITALLHDILEDTHITFDDISREFSHEVAELVEGVTKLKKINLQLEQIKQAENFRKLFLALAKDIRVLIIKLFDRLHNMRTLGYKGSASIKRIAVETLEIYAPLADRIGMHEIARELQDLAFEKINPRARGSVVRRLEELKLKAENQNLVTDIINELEILLKQNNISCHIKGREKSPYSIWRKLVKKGTTFENLFDVVGFRIIVDNISDCYKTLGIIHTKYKSIPNTFADYISVPKQNSYRSIHTAVIGPLYRRVEIQIRTEEMNLDAEYGIAAHWTYKQNITKEPNIQRGMEVWIKAMLDILKSTNNAEEFLETTKLEMYTEQIFAFTPEGDIVDLPKGATVLDFAFAIHYDIGCFCDGAKVNNVKVDRSYKIKNGDQIKVVTLKSVWPSLDWLNVAITGRAKHAIRKATRDEYLNNTKAKGMEIIKGLFIKYNKALTAETLQTLMNETMHKDLDTLYLDVANNVIDIVKFIKKVFPDVLYKKAILSMNSFNGIGGTKNTENILENHNSLWVENYFIENLPNNFFHKLACCCKPNVEDSVIGIAMPNEAIIIHKNSCSTLVNMYLADYFIIDNLVIKL